jgi:hypothetical protein
MESGIIPSKLFEKFVTDAVTAELRKSPPSSSFGTLERRLWTAAEHDCYTISSRCVDVLLLDEQAKPLPVSEKYAELINAARLRYEGAANVAKIH